jgi:hypothetical protein
LRNNDVNVVDVDVRQVGDQRIRRIVRRKAGVLAVEPLERSVRSDMDDGVRFEAFAEPGVGGDVLMMRRQILRVVHLFGVLAPAARRLRQECDLAVLHGRNDEAVVQRHHRCL